MSEVHGFTPLKHFYSTDCRWPSQTSASLAKSVLWQSPDDTALHPVSQQKGFLPSRRRPRKSGKCWICIMEYILKIDFKEKGSISRQKTSCLIFPSVYKYVLYLIQCIVAVYPSVFWHLWAKAIFHGCGKLWTWIQCKLLGSLSDRSESVSNIVSTRVMPP